MYANPSSCVYDCWETLLLPRMCICINYMLFLIFPVPFFSQKWGGKGKGGE